MSFQGAYCIKCGASSGANHAPRRRGPKPMATDREKYQRAVFMDPGSRFPGSSPGRVAGMTAWFSRYGATIASGLVRRRFTISRLSAPR